MKGVSYERRIVSNSTNTFSLSGLILVVILATLSFKRIINRQKNIATIEIKKATFLSTTLPSYSQFQLKREHPS